MTGQLHGPRAASCPCGEAAPPERMVCGRPRATATRREPPGDAAESAVPAGARLGDLRPLTVCRRPCTGALPRLGMPRTRAVLPRLPVAQCIALLLYGYVLYMKEACFPALASPRPRAADGPADAARKRFQGLRTVPWAERVLRPQPRLPALAGSGRGSGLSSARSEARLSAGNSLQNHHLPANAPRAAAHRSRPSDHRVSAPPPRAHALPPLRCGLRRRSLRRTPQRGFQGRLPDSFPAPAPEARSRCA